MMDLVLIAVIAAIAAAIVFYLVREKKRGAKCIGCPYAGQCANKNSCKK